MVRYQPPREWQQWVDWLAAGLHGRSRWRLSVILMGMLFARGRRTVTTWLRAVGISEGFANYYYSLQPLGRKAKELSERLLALLLLRLETGERLLFAVDDSLWTTRPPSGTARKCKGLAFITIPRLVCTPPPLLKNSRAVRTTAKTCCLTITAL